MRFVPSPAPVRRSGRGSRGLPSSTPRSQSGHFEIGKGRDDLHVERPLVDFGDDEHGEDGQEGRTSN